MELKKRNEKEERLYFIANSFKSDTVSRYEIPHMPIPINTNLNEINTILEMFGETFREITLVGAVWDRKDLMSLLRLCKWSFPEVSMVIHPKEIALRSVFDGIIMKEFDKPLIHKIYNYMEYGSHTRFILPNLQYLHDVHDYYALIGAFVQKKAIKIGRWSNITLEN